MKVSAKRPTKMFCPSDTTGNRLSQRLNPPIPPVLRASSANGIAKSAIAGLTLLTFFTTAVPAPTVAQVPTFTTESVPPGINRLPNTPAPPSSSQFSGASNLPPETPYTLGSGDRIRVDVFDVPEYSGEYVVLVDGTLNLPVIGSVSVQGRTLQQASAAISSLYSRYVRRPLVTLSLLAPRPVSLAIAGEVNRPGTYTVTPGGGGGGVGAAAQGGQFPTLTQVITLAGGITQAAAVGQVRIQRRTPAGTYTANLWDLLRNGNIAQDVTLRDGDSIFIPTVADVNPNDTRVLADASFAPRQVEPINVVVVGEVSRPGPYEITGGGVGTGGATGAVTGTVTGVAAGGGAAGGPPTITKALQVAGGITAMADVRSLAIRRTTRSGEPRIINVNLWDLLRAGDVSQDVILQDGDTITVPTATAMDPAEATQLAGASFSPNTIVVNVVGEVTRAGAIPVPPNTPLNQAILAAGGFNNRAKKGEVELIRLNPNGSVAKRKVRVDLAQGINDEGNPTLRNNDVVVVGRNTATRIGDTLGTILSPITNFLGFLNIFGF